MLKISEAMPLQPDKIPHTYEDFSWLAMLHETVKISQNQERPLMQGCFTSTLASTHKTQDKNQTGVSSA